MRLLIAVASKHGSTLGIAAALSDELRKQGFTTEVADVADAPPVAGYDAVVVGSAIYMGKWLPEARAFVEHNRALLEKIPVWIFSSGPLGQTDPQPLGDPAQLDTLLNITGAREHRIFVGKLDRCELGLGERLAVKLVKAPEGDFRDWEAIRSWAREIGVALRPDGALRQSAAAAPDA